MLKLGNFMINTNDENGKSPGTSTRGLLPLNNDIEECRSDFRIEVNISEKCTNATDSKN